MTYLFIAGAVLLAALAVWQALRGLPRRRLMKGLRLVVGGGAALIAVVLVAARRIDLASFFGVAAYAVLTRGRLGPFSFESAEIGQSDSISKVRSRYFAMELDHETGEVKGRVIAGQFAGADLIDLGEMETRGLIQEVETDPDSVSLLESWLDANRAGWREYFEETARAEAQEAPAADPVAEAYEVLGLKTGATAQDVRAAHRELMKGVHPDRGGSSYLASKINEARDLLLKTLGEQ